MIINLPKGDLYEVMRQFNPWWTGTKDLALPHWRRAVFSELIMWLHTPPAKRALLLRGARQIGKTTLLLQGIETLLSEGVLPHRITYLTLDHPMLKTVGLEALMQLLHDIHLASNEREYLFIDEIQCSEHWQVWLKHQVDFNPNRRIVVTGSAMPLNLPQTESGVGRWHTVHLPTLSFFEYVRLQEITPPNLATRSLSGLQELLQSDWIPIIEAFQPLLTQFNGYLLKGGFPQTAQMNDIDKAQQLLREDIIDRVLKRDMTAMYGVRHIAELEQLFLYLSLHEGCVLDIAALSRNIENLQRPTINSYLNVLEASHLIYRLPPLGYGKSILRARYKVYLADASIGPSLLLQGWKLFEKEDKLGIAVESTLMKHFWTLCQEQGQKLAYWRDRNQNEVDFIITSPEKQIPIEVKYRSPSKTIAREFKGMLAFCRKKKVSLGYLITKDLKDIGSYQSEDHITIVKLPALLTCFVDGLNG